MWVIPPETAFKFSPYIAVYGTLKYGYDNHHLLEGAKPVGVGYTRERFFIYDIGIPLAVPTKFGLPLQVEVYELKNKTVLKTLDRLEDCPKFYIRRSVKVSLRKGGELKAWLYHFDMPLGNRLNARYTDGRLNLEYTAWGPSLVFLAEELYGFNHPPEILDKLLEKLKGEVGHGKGPPAGTLQRVYNPP